VLSVLPGDGSLCTSADQYNVMLLPSTMVTFVACRYRFVILLDLSPSVGTVVSILIVIRTSTSIGLSVNCLSCPFMFLCQFSSRTIMYLLLIIAIQLTESNNS